MAGEESLLRMIMMMMEALSWSYCYSFLFQLNREDLYFSFTRTGAIRAK